MEQFLILLLCERFGLWSLQCWNDILWEKKLNHIYTYCFRLFDRFRLWSQQWFNDNEVEESHKNHTFFPNSVSLGSSAIVKVPEQVGAAKIPLRKVPRFPVPKQGSQAGFAKVPRKKFPGERFPARGSQAGFLSKVQEVPKDSQEEVPKQGSQRFRSQKFTKAPKSGFPSNLPKQGLQRFPSKASKVARNRIPKISKGSRAQVPQDSQRFSGTGSQEQVSKQGSQARFPGRGSQRFPVPKLVLIGKVRKPGSQGSHGSQGSQEQVPKDSQTFPRTRFQARFPRAGCQANFPSQVPKQVAQRFSGRGSQ